MYVAMLVACVYLLSLEKNPLNMEFAQTLTYNSIPSANVSTEAK